MFPDATSAEACRKNANWLFLFGIKYRSIVPQKTSEKPIIAKKDEI